MQYDHNLQLWNRTQGKFPVRYDYRVVNYDPREFTRLATEEKAPCTYLGIMPMLLIWMSPKGLSIITLPLSRRQLR